jgi:hypothetical protein
MQTKIKGFTGYEVVNDGRVISLAREIKNRTKNGGKTIHKLKQTKELKPMFNGHNYRVELCKNGKRKTVFIKNLIAQAFVPIPKEIVKPTVVHKDGDVSNNHFENLEWVSLNWARRVSNIKK